MSAILGLWGTLGASRILIPAGGIIGLSSLILPLGYTTFAAADDHYIIGAGGNLAVGDTADPEATFDVASNGGHNGSGTSYRYWLANRINYGGKNKTVNNNSGILGAHTHSTTIKHNPDANNYMLIQASTEAPLPANGVLFSDDLIEDMDLDVSLNDNNSLVRADGTQVGLETRLTQISQATSTMYHKHTMFCGNGCSDGYSNSVSTYGSPATTFTHDHTGIDINSGVTKQIALKAFRAIEDMDGVKGSVIILYPSNLIPTGWAICDGSNGTPDCRDAFLTNKSDGAGIVTGDNMMGASGTTGSFAHNHYYNATNVAAVTMPHISNVIHDHDYSWSGELLPKHYALNFIKYIG